MQPTLVPHTAPYRPNARKIGQLCFAGAVAAGTMLLVASLIPLFGFPAPDFGALYGVFFHGGLPPDRFSLPWWGGMAVHLAATVLLLPILFDYLADQGVIPSFRWLKGVLWGLALWFVVEAVVKPLTGFGFFSSQMPSPAGTIFFALLVWYVYGVALEGALRVRVVHELNGVHRGLDDRRAA